MKVKFHDCYFLFFIKRNYFLLAKVKYWGSFFLSSNFKFNMPFKLIQAWLQIVHIHDLMLRRKNEHVLIIVLLMIINKIIEFWQKNRQNISLLFIHKFKRMMSLYTITKQALYIHVQSRVNNPHSQYALEFQFGFFSRIIDLFPNENIKILISPENFK